MMDWVKIGRQYANEVLDGKTPANRWIRLACKRSEEDFDRFAAHDSVYLFDEGKANSICEFLTGLQHVQDSILTKAGDRFVPLPWQAWVLTSVYGWVWRDTGKRRVRRAYSEMGRGNGKSALSSGVVLYSAFAEGVGGAQVVCAASMQDQARIVLDGARRMCQANTDLCRLLGLEVRANKIIQPRSNSVLWALPAKSSSAEGLSTDFACLDELHAARGRSLFDTLALGCSKKNDSLFWCISTAGDDASGVAYELHNFAEKLLVNEVEDDSSFFALYGIDPEMDWRTNEAHRCANPSYGVTIDPRTMMNDCKRAQQIRGSQASFRTKHLTEWIMNGGEIPFLDEISIRKCYEPDLDESQFAGTPCAVGCDLASRLDLASCYRIHSKRIDGKVHHYAFGKNFLPETQRKANVAYPAWEQRGELVFTPGTTTDQDVIETHLTGEMEKFQVREISFDPIQSSMLVTHLEKKRTGSTVEVAQSAKYLTPGVLELQEAVASGRLHTNSQILIWCLGHLRCRTIGSNMLQPIRPADHSLKIDSAVACIMALRSIALVALDETPRAPRVFFIDWEQGTVTNGAEDRPL
ncbi:MAG: terminase large subunit [Candidatus Acidiferrum sp.]